MMLSDLYICCNKIADPSPFNFIHELPPSLIHIGPWRERWRGSKKSSNNNEIRKKKVVRKKPLKKKNTRNAGSIKCLWKYRKSELFVAWWNKLEKRSYFKAFNFFFFFFGNSFKTFVSHNHNLKFSGPNVMNDSRKYVVAFNVLKRYQNVRQTFWIIRNYIELHALKAKS